ncbi:MAG: GNAT family N-acetyltransferase [Actinobacteria bacterium]|nr:GNAT family N-acetyltransferase [Actinomycetota bacterium]
MSDGAEVRLRMLTAGDVDWVVEVDRETTPFAGPIGWEPEALAGQLEAGDWASDDRWGWGVLADGEPAGFALVNDIRSGDAVIDLRVSATHRGRGIGREVLRQLADHHFAEHAELTRLSGRTHEQNVPMQRAFNAAGFRMEARYRDSFALPDGGPASEWGYALTRADWQAGRHRADEHGYDLHGLQFEVEEITGQEPHVVEGTIYKFLQEGRRILARYAAGDIVEGELAGTLVNDLLVYRYVHDLETERGLRTVTGGGRSRLQRRQDSRLELVNEWNGDDGRHGRQVLVECR